MEKKFAPFIILLPLLTLILAGCGQDERSKEGDIILLGKLDNAQSSYLILEELTPSDLRPIDTIFTNEEGRFSYSMFIEDAGFYRLIESPSNFISLAIEPDESIYVEGDKENLAETYLVSGSPGSDILWKLSREKHKGMKQVDSLRSIFRESRHKENFQEIRKELITEYRLVKSQQREYAISIIEDNPGALASILALYQYFEDHILLKESEHFEYFEKLSKSLCQRYPSNKHVIDLKKRVNDHRRKEEQRRLNEKNLAIGKMAPEINLPDVDGNPLPLSSFRGNIVLIDFWAAWCPPCREANVTLGGLYEKYKNKGFEIYGVSLDRTREQWVNAIKQDKITWPQVSDLRFMNSPVVNLYSISEIPFTVLIDKEGRILARDFSTDELENLLIEHL